MTETVRCYAGSSYPEKPRSLTWGNRDYEVQAILSQRREPDGVGFRVRCSPGEALFDLFYITETGTWRIRPVSINLSTSPTISTGE